MNHVASVVDPLQQERILIIGPPQRVDPRWVSRLAERFADLDVSRADSYLAGIADLCRRPARAVLVSVDSAATQMENAVAALREAAGPSARLVLCCAADAEPLARRAAAAGADEYLLCPLRDDEVDAALGRLHVPEVAADSAAPATSMDELSALATVLSSVSDKPMVLLERAASLIRAALDAPGAMIVVDGAAATSGERVIRPVLTAPLLGEAGVRGQLAVNERPARPYTLGDAQKLNQYAQILSGILATASQQRNWRRLAFTDGCSGLPNRRYLNEQLHRIVARAAQEQLPVTVLFFDLDDFKTYNDRFGHHAGDEIIRVIGQLFRKNCREQDVIARYGGDEFAVVFWDPEGPRAAGSKHPDCALTVLDRFKTALKTEQFPGLGPTAQGTLTISGGLATYPWDGATPEALIQRADEALLAAKRAGKNRIYLIGDAK